MEWAARAIGVFYVLGGLMLLYQAWLNWRLQRALAGLMTLPVAEQIGDGVVALAAVLILLSGAALTALSAWAVLAFIAGWTIQALYLLCAPDCRRDSRPSAVHCRRRSIHAFAGYTAVTGLVLCLPMTGVLG